MRRGNSSRIGSIGVVTPKEYLKLLTGDELLLLPPGGELLLTEGGVTAHLA